MDMPVVLHDRQGQGREGGAVLEGVHELRGVVRVV